MTMLTNAGWTKLIAILYGFNVAKFMSAPVPSIAVFIHILYVEVTPSFIPKPKTIQFMSVGSIVSKPEYASAHGVHLIEGKLPVVFLTVFRQ